MTVRIMLVDDHGIFVSGLSRILADEPWAEVVGTAADAAGALEVLRGGSPDVAVVDLRLGDAPESPDGVAVTVALRRENPGLRVLLLTMHADEASAQRALAAGATGYVLKDADPDDVLAAIRQVARGDLVLSGRVAGAAGSASGGDGVGAPLPELTEREREVLELVARGVSTEAIARQLFLSTKTVRNRLSQLYAKLGVGSRAEAVVRAREAGLGR
ncbi:MAG TPA: response regulator transcription factor [Actinomycetales bacterium]|jgi:DNA-binding NarL/FixJ family response regulator|nr:response regulator transcription factor [Actinomycetales bacterium]